MKYWPFKVSGCLVKVTINTRVSVLTVNVHLTYHIRQFLVWRVLPQGLHDCPQLLRGYVPVPILIKEAERLLQFWRTTHQSMWDFFSWTHTYTRKHQPTAHTLGQQDNNGINKKIKFNTNQRLKIRKKRAFFSFCKFSSFETCHIQAFSVFDHHLHFSLCIW